MHKLSRYSLINNHIDKPIIPHIHIYNLLILFYLLKKYTDKPPIPKLYTISCTTLYMHINIPPKSLHTFCLKDINLEQISSEK